MPYIHALDPVLFSIGPLAIRYYSLAYIIGFLLAYYSLNHARKQGKLDITEDQVNSFLLALMIGVVVGARMVHVLSHPSFYFPQPALIFAVWQGGLAFFGGLLGAALAGWWFSRKAGISLAQLADLLILPAMAGLALGRIANFINGELVGIVTEVSWCVVFPGIEGCRHPYQLYAAGLFFSFLGVLWWIRSKQPKEGLLFWSFALLMGLGRLLLDIVREDPRWFGLSIWQYLGLLLFLVSSFVLWNYYRTSSNKQESKSI